MIIHWHGPKPERCLNCYISLWEEIKTSKDVIKQCKCPSGYNHLWNLAMEADRAALYKKLVRDHAKYASVTGDDPAMLGSY